MATLRRDGSPRISGTEIQLVDGQMRIGSTSGAVKAKDLRLDPRVAIHGPTHEPAQSGRWRGEAKIAGRAVELAPEGDAHTFQIEIDEVVLTRLNKARDRLVIESWNARIGYRVTERA